MKTQLLLLAFFLLSACFVGELPPDMDDRIQFYYDGEDSVQLTLIPGKYFLVVDADISREELANELFVPPAQLGMMHTLSLSDLEESYDFRWTSISDAGPEANWENENLHYRAPYFFSEGGAELGLTHLFTVTLLEEKDSIKVEELAEAYRVELMGKNVDNPLRLLLRCHSSSDGNALEISQTFHASGNFGPTRPLFMDQQQLF